MDKFIKLLEVYTVEEILEANDLEACEVLEILYDLGYINLEKTPEPL